MQQSSLFEVAEAGEIIALPDADLQYFPAFYRAHEANDLFEALVATTSWRQESIKIAGMQRLQPRLSAWYGDSDDETELGPSPIIASLTLGASRDFAFKHKTRPELRYKIKLAHGSLLIMRGTTQRYWLHAIAKEKAPVEARINLTFRRIFSEKSPT